MQSVFANEHNLSFINRLQQHLLRYGYLPRETNLIDDANLFLTKAGDRMIDQMFTFQRNGRELAFRPEFTASAARHYALNSGSYSQTTRWQFSGPIFTSNEHGGTSSLSVGAELIGVGASTADVEIIAAAVTGLHALDFDDYRVVIGNVSLTKAILEYYDLDQRTQRFIINHRAILQSQGIEEFMTKIRQYLLIRRTGENQPSGVAEELTASMLRELLSAREKHIGTRTAEDIIGRLLKKQRQASQYDNILAAVTLLEALFTLEKPAADAFRHLHELVPDSDPIVQLIREWQFVVEGLFLHGISEDRITIRPSLALTWDYYTGIVFEVRSCDDIILASGGRYDDLISLMETQVDSPAVGFAYHISQFESVISLETQSPEQHIYSMYVSEINEYHRAVEWLTLLRSKGINVCVVLSEEEADLRITENDLYIIAAGRQYPLKHIHTVAEVLLTTRGAMK